MNYLYKKVKKDCLYLIILCSLSFIFISLVSVFVFEFFPFSGDEYSYIFQSKIFKSGSLYYDSPPNPEFFELHHVVNNGKWYSKYPFGWPLILFLGEIFNLRWIVNPLVGIFTLIFVFYFTKFMFNEDIAYISTFLMAISPFFIFSSSSYFPHSVSLLFSILFLFAYFLTLRKGGWAYPIASGLFLGLVFFIRPIDSLIVGLPLGIYSIVEVRKNKRLLKRLSIILVTIIIFSSVPLYINYILTGNPLRFSYQVYNPNDTLWPEGYNFVTGVENTKHHFSFLFLWLPLIILFIPFAKFDKIKLLLLSIFLLNIVIYFFYHSAGGDQFGPRYYYISFLGIIILAGSAINRLRLNKKVVLSLLLLINLSLNIYFAYDIHKEVLFRKQVYDHVKDQNIHNSIIFLKSTNEQGCAWYTRNSPSLNDDNLYVCDLGTKNKVLIETFPSREVYFYNLGEMDQPYSNYHKSLVW